jgi:hypothetical protein
MNPEPVSRQQVGDLEIGRVTSPALDVHIHLGSGQVEGLAIGVQSG